MRVLVKWVAVLATVAATWTIFAPMLWHPSHVQTLTNVLLGEFAAIALGHTAYRFTSGTDPSTLASLGGAGLGVVIAVSPLLFGLTFGLTTSNMVCGGLIAIAGIASFVVSRVQSPGREARRPGIENERTEAA